MKKTVLKFYSNGCGPCRIYAPTFEKVKLELSESITFQEINTDEDIQGISAQYKVRGIPCTVILRDEVEVARIAGPLTEEQLRELILIN